MVMVKRKKLLVQPWCVLLNTCCLFEREELANCNIQNELLRPFAVDMQKRDASQVPVQESVVPCAGDGTNGHGESTAVLHLSCVPYGG
jgi:hypothetical protein